MKSHQQIDQRGLELARRIAVCIDSDPQRLGLEKARACCARWMARDPRPSYEEWSRILAKSWDEIRTVLLDESEEGNRLRQNSPFCGVLTPAERWLVFKEFDAHEAA